MGINHFLPPGRGDRISSTENAVGMLLQLIYCRKIYVQIVIN